MAPHVLMICGAYWPEFSSGGLQSQAAARLLAGRAHFRVLTTSTSAGLAPAELVDFVPVTRVHIDIASRWSRAVAGLKLFAALCRLVPAADVVHLQGFSSKNILASIAARVFHRPTLVHLQTSRHDEPEAIASQGRLAWWSFTTAKRYVSVSPGLQASYLEAGLPPNRIRVVPNGVDTARFIPASPAARRDMRGALGLSPERPMVLFVGVLSEDKQPHVLLDAWYSLQSHPATASTLVFVGATNPSLYELGGRLADRMREDLARRGLADRVVFVEPTHQIERFYQAADVVVMPSLREGWPNVLLEAMSSGVPVVASRLPGSTDVLIEDGVTGRLVAPGDVGGFAAAIAEVLQDPALAARRGADARRGVEARYDMQKIADQWLNAYTELLANA
jgi:glycosyltransferase involved in cell wall biosynthesis